MRYLPDRTVEHLRRALEAPDFSGTRYRLIEEIGRGGMGAVYAAEDTVLGREVALKVLREADLAGEARVMARLEHPGIVPVHDAGTLPDGRAWYAMKRVEGLPLDQFRGSLAERLRLFQKVCEAVAFAHARGVIHRDLKPDNIMVGTFGEVLVMDWGVATAGGEGDVAGTPAYMAPEQARGERVDARTDVYALGAVLRDLCHDAERRRPLDSICWKAMAAEPEARYQTVEGLRTDVARYLDRLPVSAHRENLLERAGRVAGRYQALLLLVLAYLIMRALLIIFAGR